MSGIIKPLQPNIFASTDYYKMTHHKQIPNNLTKLFTYGEARKGARYPHVMMFGMTMMIVDHFLQEPTKEMLEEARELCITMGREDHFNKDVCNKILNLGHLPMRIKAVPEGSVVPVDNVLFTMESTEPWFAKAMNVYETLMMNIWFPISTSTRSMYIYARLKPFIDKTGSDFMLPYSVHDFSERGHTSWQSCYRGSAGHLILFDGTDSNDAVRALNNYYQAGGKAGKSVWATEHSVATNFGPGQGEFDYINWQLDNAADDEIVSIVIDSYDSNNFMDNIVGSKEVSDKIKARKGRTVFRPDSGNAKLNIHRYLESLRNTFGYFVNDKGYKVLNDNVGLLQGDGMNEDTIIDLYESITKSNWSSDNLVTGSGGGLMVEGLTRDTERFAIKASYGERDGVGFNIQKDPLTQPDKKSKTGMLKLMHTCDTHYSTISSADNHMGQFIGYIDAMETVFENGKLINPPTFDKIQERAQLHLSNIDILK